MAELLKIIEQTVATSYAHNSFFYRFLENTASLEQLVTFMHWDSQQPTFQHYLANWLVKAPAALRPALEQHILEEQDHGAMFADMMRYLKQQCSIDEALDMLRLDKLNYTFFKQCVAEQDFAFFCGGFFATEYMAGKRYQQLVNGFERCGIDKKHLDFIVVHSDCEEAHSMSALEDLIKPMVSQGGFSGVMAGVLDRLERSRAFLCWYEAHRI